MRTNFNRFNIWAAGQAFRCSAAKGKRVPLRGQKSFPVAFCPLLHHRFPLRQLPLQSSKGTPAELAAGVHVPLFIFVHTNTVLLLKLICVLDPTLVQVFPPGQSAGETWAELNEKGLIDVEIIL